jgi:broad specificity phosphatase PhoE
MNHLEGITSLNKEYYVMRHGRSQANKYGLIVSNLAWGEGMYGLTEEGEGEVQKSIDEAICEGVIDYAQPVAIFSSRFLRARKTAEIVEKSLYSSKIIPMNDLSERDFGDLDLEWDVKYKTVWENDKRSIEQTEYNVESVSRVLNRTTNLIQNIDRGLYVSEKQKQILLISHGDPLNILQTVFFGISPMHHRNVALNTGEIRKLELL